MDSAEAAPSHHTSQLDSEPWQAPSLTPLDPGGPLVTSLSRRRRTAALIALTLGGFGIGSTESVAMGLLPDMAGDLLPDLYSRSADAGSAQVVGSLGEVIRDVGAGCRFSLRRQVSTH